MYVCMYVRMYISTYILIYSQQHHKLEGMATEFIHSAKFLLQSGLVVHFVVKIWY